jgi:hypothetical protein
MILSHNGNDPGSFTSSRPMPAPCEALIWPNINIPRTETGITSCAVSDVRLISLPEDETVNFQGPRFHEHRSSITSKVRTPSAAYFR